MSMCSAIQKLNGSFINIKNLTIGFWSLKIILCYYFDTLNLYVLSRFLLAIFYARLFNKFHRTIFYIFLILLLLIILETNFAHFIFYFDSFAYLVSNEILVLLDAIKHTKYSNTIKYLFLDIFSYSTFIEWKNTKYLLWSTTFVLCISKINE